MARGCRILTGRGGTVFKRITRDRKRGRWKGHMGERLETDNRLNPVSRMYLERFPPSYEERQSGPTLDGDS